MGLFRRRRQSTPDTVTVNGRELRCLVCGHDRFLHRKAQLNTSVATFFTVDWANPTADCFGCETCGHLHWFFGETRWSSAAECRSYHGEPITQ